MTIYNKEIAKKIIDFTLEDIELHEQRELKPLVESTLLLNIPLNACKMCNLNCGTCGYRCNYFKFHYNPDYGYWDNTKNDWVFHNIETELFNQIIKEKNNGQEKEARITEEN